MKTATARKLRNELPAVLRLLRNGESVAITHRNKTVAILTPPPADTPADVRPWANLDALWAELQAQPMLAQSGADLLAEDRENRF